MLLLAAAHETGLLDTFAAALAPLAASAPRRIHHLLTAGFHTLLLTLLFFTVAGLRRPWDLRAYTGTMLGLLTGRPVPYSVWTIERVLSFLARSNADQLLTIALMQWATRLWHPHQAGYLLTTPIYIDSHKKAVYSDVLIPRGRIGKTGKILGCRTQILLHDAAGHPLALLTDRGDLHLIAGMQRILSAFEQATESMVRTIIVDREGLSADFFAQLVDEQRIITTVLRRNQYQGLESFQQAGQFEPLDVDAEGRVVREVARASYTMPVPSRPEQPLRLNVALIRDHRHRRPDETPDLLDRLDDANGDDDDPSMRGARASEPRLIPIVTTGVLAKPAELVQLYRRRWPAQENVIKDWLIPLGIEVNEGYAKQPVENSEAAKQQAVVAKRAATLAKRCQAAEARWTQARQEARMSEERAQQTAALAAVVQPEWRAQTQAVAATTHTEARRAHERAAELRKKCDQLRAQQQAVAQEAAALAAPPPMFALDNRKDQLLSVCKVAAANLGMWVRDMFFPADYAQATWGRLQPFLELRGQVQRVGDETVVELQPFHNRQLNRDLAVLCAKVEERAPRLPDGSRLRFWVAQEQRPILSRSSGV